MNKVLVKFILDHLPPSFGIKYFKNQEIKKHGDDSLCTKGYCFRMQNYLRPCGDGFL